MSFFIKKGKSGFKRKNTAITADKKQLKEKKKRSDEDEISSHSQFESCAKNLNIFFSTLKPVANDLIYLIMSSYTSGLCFKCLNISFSILLHIVSFQLMTKAVQPEASFAETFKNLQFIPQKSERPEIKILTPISRSPMGALLSNARHFIFFDRNCRT